MKLKLGDVEDKWYKSVGMYKICACVLTNRVVTVLSNYLARNSYWPSLSM